MYLRRTTRRLKDGSAIGYLQLAHNERNERGVPVARVLHSFGREDAVQRAALERLVGSINRYLGEDGLAQAGAAPRTA